MLSTAIELLDATRNSLFDEDIWLWQVNYTHAEMKLPDEIFSQIYLYVFIGSIC